ILSADDGALDAVLERVWELPRGESDFVTVIVPELFRRRALREQLRRPLQLRLKLRLLAEPGVVVADVPVVAGDSLPQRLVVRVLVSDVHAASMRAVNYARTLDVADTRAVFFASDADDASRLRDAWRQQSPRLSLDVHEAPYRDIGAPLL